MDVPALVVAIATTAAALEDLYEPAEPLTILKSQVNTLDSRAQRIQEWLHFTEPSSKVKASHSLRAAVRTVNAALERLRWDVSDIFKHNTEDPKVAENEDGHPKRQESIKASLLAVHLVDLGECASLMHFTLAVCQLPDDENAEQDIAKLKSAADMLLHAHNSPWSERRDIVQRYQSRSRPGSSSEDFEILVEQITEAEADLPHDAPAVLNETRISQMSTLSSLTKLSDVTLAPLKIPSRASTVYTPHHHNESALPDEPVGLALSTPEDDVAPLAFPSPALKESIYVVENGRPGQSRSPSTVDFRIPASASQIPPIPQRSADRAERGLGSAAVQSQTQIRRKAVQPANGSAQSVSGATASRSKAPYLAQAQVSSASLADSAFSIAEKITPLSHSLSSLSTSEYLNVGLDAPPVQPYVDIPPGYSQASDALTALSAMDESPTSRRRTMSSPMGQIGGPLMNKLATENRIEEIRSAIQQGYNVNDIDPRSGRNAIMEAAQSRHWAACRLLLQSGARLHLRDTSGDTALHIAARVGDADICQMLVDAAALSEDCNKAGHTPIELAAAGGHTQAVHCLINAVPSRKTNDATLVKAFLETVKIGDISTAQALIAANVKPRKIQEPWRPTAYAAQSGSLPMLELMTLQKCSLKERSPGGWTPLHFAAKHGQAPMVQKLLACKLSVKTQAKKSEETPLHIASAAGHTAAALTILSHKDASATVRDAENHEPIHHAVRHGDARLMAALIDQGAKLSTASKYGWKPIHIATAYGHTSLLAECMTRGSSIEEKLVTPSFKPEKRTNAAARRGYWAEIRWPHPGARPLHLSLEFGHDDAANMLLAGGAQVDESDSRGWRPLHYAAFHCRPEVLQSLIQRGATVDAKTIDGHTALSLGFREHGLHASQSQRMRVRETLELAMMGLKKPKLRSMTSLNLLSSNSASSKTAAQRNMAWHTARLAESLYNTGGLQDGEEDAWSLDGSEVASSSRSGGSAGHSLHEAQPGSTRLTKP